MDGSDYKLSMAKQHPCIGSGETQATLIMLGWITGNGDNGTCNDRLTYLLTKSTGTDMMLIRETILEIWDQIEEGVVLALIDKVQRFVIVGGVELRLGLDP